MGALVRADFNSIKVRLEPNLAGDNNAVLGFQFHKGTIRTSVPVYLLLEIFYFNSIKVRLEHRAPSFGAHTLKFQFHKGTIRTLTPWKKWEYGTQFQFHKGTIRTWAKTKGLDFDNYFNSIKVRLEHNIPKPNLWRP